MDLKPVADPLTRIKLQNSPRDESLKRHSCFNFQLQRGSFRYAVLWLYIGNATLPLRTAIIIILLYFETVVELPGSV